MHHMMTKEQFDKVNKHMFKAQPAPQRLNQTVRGKAEYWLAMNVAGYTEQQVGYLAALLKELDNENEDLMHDIAHLRAVCDRLRAELDEASGVIR